MAFNDFTPDRLRAIRSGGRGQIHAELAMLSETVETNRLRHVRREWMAHDADNNPVGIKRAPVNDTAQDGQLITAVLTVLTVRRIDLLCDEEHDSWAPLSFVAARTLGYKTVGGAKTAWFAKHPRSPLVKLVYFVLGDFRDRRVFLTSTRRMRWQDGPAGKAVGDYTSNPRIAADEAEVLTDEEYNVLALANNQKDVRRRVDQAVALSAQSLADRIAAIEAVGADMRSEVRQELRIMTTRAGRFEERLGLKDGPEAAASATLPAHRAA